jgi:hypothetical protein
LNKVVQSLSLSIDYKARAGHACVGVCNPAGEAADYNGLYFTDAELRELARGQLQDVPSKDFRQPLLGDIVYIHKPLSNLPAYEAFVWMLRFRWHQFLIAEIHRNHQPVLRFIVGLFKAKFITQRFYHVVARIFKIDFIIHLLHLLEDISGCSFATFNF